MRGLRARRRLSGLERFTVAQDAQLSSIELELRGGAKLGHWMWFVFPNERGLGRSPTARYYAVTKREARRYLRHPVLGQRLLRHTDIVTGWLRRGYPLTAIFSEVDAMKFRSCMALMWHVSGEARFREALEADDGVTPSIAVDRDEVEAVAKGAVAPDVEMRLLSILRHDAAPVVSLRHGDGLYELNDRDWEQVTDALAGSRHRRDCDAEQ